ncbi:ribosome small subunit-dependent GTPase A [Arthrobacter pityocampae]|uniref:Small ribosomal subunit biogenesis GTPase RsgA n=1 Tax=Arthrobacter pityocampae TaxID=547334 RepID=A0A2S5ITK3_9MICC|nr:ribosome small subunit-dependent GTPase A [Arthrobacter pityocampae]PPB47875.1 ribosome small subunit-dependent GTPase A [Arthrobacter pityocampae]
MNTLLQYGFTDRIGALFSFHFPSGVQPARIVRADRGRVLVATPDGILHLDSPDSLVTGDWIGLVGDGRIAGHLPRSSLLQRKRAYDPLSEAQALAANIDLLGVVVPLDRPLSTNRLERTLVAAWDSGAVPLVVLTKADLSSRFDGVVAETVDRARGVEVLTTSAEVGDGLEHLRGRIGAGQTLALLGPSGAGKSSLINALVDDARQGTGEVRATDGRGRHTTTARELVPLGDGGVLMDTPGLRGFALWDAEDGLSQVFGDVEELFARCRFRDCAHESEPGCAVQSAIASGDLEERRWLSYRKMDRELASLHRRQNVAEQRRYGRSFHRVAQEAARAKDYRNRFREG